MENPSQSQTTLAQEKTVSQLNKNPSLLMLLSGVVLVTAIVAGGIGYYFGLTQKTQTQSLDRDGRAAETPESNGVACTLDAKVCPDGSSVGRSGPNCEFEACPSVTSDSVLPNGWSKVGKIVSSAEGCYQVQISDIGQLDDMGYYVAENNPGVDTFEPSKYFLNKYQTLVVPGQGIGEIETIYVNADNNVYTLAVKYTGKGEGTVNTKEETAVCEQRERELERVINSITF